MNEHAGHVISRRLSELDKTQTWLARKVGVSNNSVTKWIRTGQIKRSNLVAVANALGIDAETLLLVPVRIAPERGAIARMCRDPAVAMEIIAEAAQHLKNGERKLAAAMLKMVAAGLEGE